jgi:hypothetical protein
LKFALKQRQAGIRFATTVYWKKNFSHLLAQCGSFVPKRGTYDVMSLIFCRAIKICSTYEALDEDVNKIDERVVENDYSVPAVESGIRRQRNLR